MNILSVYDSSDDEPLNTAPNTALQVADPSVYHPSAGTLTISHNVPYDQLNKPLQGPLNPYAREMNNKNMLTGNSQNSSQGSVEQHNMSELTFYDMQRTYDRLGYTRDPETGEWIGDLKKMAQNQGNFLNHKHARAGKTILESSKTDKSKRKKRKPAGKADDVDAFAGPWAKFEGESSDEEASPVQEEESKPVVSTKPVLPKDYEYTVTESTKFHGREERDYLGRTYMHVPNDVDVDLTIESGNQTCFLPKKLLHTYTGHTKGVNTIRLFPNSGHLILSASQDCKVKLWDVYHDRKCLRTFSGHDNSVKDIVFTNDGTKFLSASFDKWIKLWDTETGQCISRFTTKKVPFCVTFNPDADKQNIFLTGCQDKKIYQFDINTGKVVQEYDQHLGTVNSITFIDENRRFISTSDDKTIRAWDYDIPVVIKYMADPGMQSMPTGCLSPNSMFCSFHETHMYRKVPGASILG